MRFGKKIHSTAAKVPVSAFVIALVVVTGLAFLGSHLANSSDAAKLSTALPIGLYLSPASARIAQGSTLSVTLYENSGTEIVNAAQAKLTYDPYQLQYSGISEGTAFPLVLRRTYQLQAQ